MTNAAPSPNQLNVVVVGIIRNVAKTLNKEIHRLNHTFSLFNTTHWLVVESDSTDKTQQELALLKQQIDNFNYLCLGDLQPSIPERTERIAYCRNAYLKEIEDNTIYDNCDLVIMVDLDGVNNVLTASGLKSCFIRNDWDVITANTEGPYYDIWALRHPTWCPTDCWQEYNFLTSYGWKRYPAAFSTIYSRMITIPPSSQWMKVNSSFAGLGIYKKQILKGLRYQGYENGNPVCEHVPFHKEIKNIGGNIYINPQLLNCKNPPHTRKLRYPHSLKLRLRMLLSAIPR